MGSFIDFLKFLGVVILAIVCLILLIGVVGGWISSEIQKMMQDTAYSSVPFIIAGILAFVGLIFAFYYFRKH